MTPGGALASTTDGGADPRPAPPGASIVIIEDPPNPAAPANPAPPSVSVLIQEANAEGGAGATPSTDGLVVAAAIAASGSPVPDANGSAAPAGGDPLVKKLIAETTATLELQEASASAEVPKFKHVPGVGLVPETSTPPDTAEGDSAQDKEDNGGKAGTITADARPNDADPATAAAPTVGGPASSDVASPPPTNTAGDDEKNKETTVQEPATKAGGSENPLVGDAAARSEYASALNSPRATTDSLPVNGSVREGGVLLSGTTHMVRLSIISISLVGKALLHIMGIFYMLLQNHGGSDTSSRGQSGRDGDLGGRLSRPTASSASKAVHKDIVCDGECGVRENFTVERSCLIFPPNSLRIYSSSARSLLAAAINASNARTMIFAVHVLTRAFI